VSPRVHICPRPAPGPGRSSGTRCLATGQSAAPRNGQSGWRTRTIEPGAGHCLHTGHLRGIDDVHWFNEIKQMLVSIEAFNKAFYRQIWLKDWIFQNVKSFKSILFFFSYTHWFMVSVQTKVLNKSTFQLISAEWRLPQEKSVSAAYARSFLGSSATHPSLVRWLTSANRQGDHILSTARSNTNIIKYHIITSAW